LGLAGQPSGYHAYFAGRFQGKSQVVKHFNVFVAIAVLAVVVPRVASAQHITIDGRLSPAQTLVGPNYTIGANLGKQVGGNLFHSFGQFSLANTPVPRSPLLLRPAVWDRSAT
jgi:hypothetical protein